MATETFSTTDLHRLQHQLAACRGLRHDPASLRQLTNHELARHLGVSRRCVQY
jgi:hypothetical protein